MDDETYQRRRYGLAAIHGYLLENIETATGEEVLDYMVASAELVRDSGGDLRDYIEGVCAAFPTADDAVRQELRDTLWTKLSSSL